MLGKNKQFDIYIYIYIFWGHYLVPNKGSKTAVRFSIVLQPRSQQGSKTAVRFTIVSQPSPQQGSKTPVGFTVVLQPSPQQGSKTAVRFAIFLQPSSQQGSKTAVRFTIVSQPSPQHLSASLEIRTLFLMVIIWVCKQLPFRYKMAKGLPNPFYKELTTSPQTPIFTIQKL